MFGLSCWISEFAHMYWYAMSRRELIVHSIVWQLMFQRSTLSWGQSPSKRKINLSVFLSTNRDLSCVPLTRRGQTWSRSPEAKTAQVSVLVFKQAQSARRAAVLRVELRTVPLHGEGEAGLVEGKPVGGLATSRKRWLHSLNFQKCPTGRETQKNKHQLNQKGEDLNLPEGRRSVLQDMRCLNAILHSAISRTTRGLPRWW